MEIPSVTAEIEHPSKFIPFFTFDITLNLSMDFRRRWLIIIFLIALGVRLLPLLWAISEPKRLFSPDSHSYWRLAEELAKSGAYAVNDEPELFRTPGYPFFLAFLMRLGVNNGVQAAFVQAIIGAASCVLLFGLVRKLMQAFPELLPANVKTAHWLPLLSALLLAVSTVSVAAANLILSENLFTFLFLVLLFGVEKWLTWYDGAQNFQTFRGKSSAVSSTNRIRCFLSSSADSTKCILAKIDWRLSALALVSGVLVLVRAIFLPLLPVFAFYLAVRSGKVKPAVLFLVIALLVPFSWSIRNLHTADYFGIATVSDINIYRYKACALQAHLQNRDFAEVQKEFSTQLAEAGGQREQAEFARSRGLAILSQAPGRYLLVHTRSSLNALLPDFGNLAALFGAEVGGRGTLAVLQTEGLAAGVKHYFEDNFTLAVLSIPFVGLLLTQYLGAGTAIIYFLRRKHGFVIVLLFHLVLLGWLLFIPGPASHPRFRVPAQPIICFYGAAGLMIGLMFFKAEKKGPGKCFE